MDHGITLSNQRGDFLKACTRWLPVFALICCIAGPHETLGATTGADAVVLVNSASAKYSDFRRWIQPYLDNFGVPYTVQDISTNVSTASLTNCALIIIGHKQLDTNHAYLDSN